MHLLNQFYVKQTVYAVLVTASDAGSQNVVVTEYRRQRFIYTFEVETSVE